ncbi:hypothetical protein [Fodinicola feengrottensis]|uniref:hypothetical protein n=1 Tax=Fodinicola feengrottensis TaxID=435914 RepID=UPI0013D4F303|nr:hypothetical protein [Fodinicola feengrottensis]
MRRLAKRTVVEAELTSDRKATESSFVSRSERRWRTMQTARSVLVVVGNVASFDRLRSFLSCMEADHRIRLVFAVSKSSVFSQSLREALGQLGIIIASWSEVSYHSFDLILTTSVLPWPEGPTGTDRPAGPVLLIPSVGFELQIAARQLDDSYRIVLADESARDRLREAAPGLADQAVIYGDPSFDQLVASLPQRASYRRTLGVSSMQKLVVVASTWGTSSLFAEHFDLVQRLLAVLPFDEYQVCLVPHPNTWEWHGPFQVERWLGGALDRGLLLIPPLGGQQATLVAADVVIGDHGSATSYAAALGHPVLRVPSQAPTDIAPAEVNAGRHAASEQLDPAGDLHRQVETAIKRSATRSSVATTNIRTPEAAIKSGKELRSTLYQMLELDAPAAPWQPEPVPAPQPVRREPATQAVSTHVRALDHLARELAREIHEGLTPSTQRPSVANSLLDGPVADEFITLRDIAGANPKEAVLRAWNRIENLMYLTIREFSYIDLKPSALAMTDELLKIGIAPQLVRVARMGFVAFGTS